MSKKLNISILSAAVLSAGALGLTTIYNNGIDANAKTAENNQLIAAATDKTTELGASLVDETVYVFSKTDGSVRKTISSDWTKNSLGLDEYTKTEKDVETPIKLKVTYTLDGKEISAKDLKGKSGKVTISYEYENTSKSGGLYVPYAVMSGLILDNNIFTNVEVEGGKLVNDGDKSIVAGIAFPGLRENLGVSKSDLNIPTSLKITADAKDFKLGLTMSIATSEIFSELDTSNFDNLNNLTGQLGKLESGMDQLISGSSALYNGLSELNEKSGALISGINQLSAGATELKNGTEKLASGLKTAETGAKQASAGLTQLASKNSTIVSGVKQAASGIETAAAKIQQVEAYLDPSNPAQAQIKDNLDAIIEQALIPVANGLRANVTYSAGTENLAAYLAGVEALADSERGVPYLAAKLSEAAAGAEALNTGAKSLETGLTTLNSNTPALKDGVAKLQQGAGDLNSGLNTFNEQGVSKLISAAGSLEKLAKNLKSTVNLAKTQRPVKYVYRVDEIK